MSETVWLVTATGVYDQGCRFVAWTLADALAFCEQWSADDDGYHAWRIDEMRVGVVPADAGLTPKSDVKGVVRWQAGQLPEVGRWSEEGE